MPSAWKRPASGLQSYAGPSDGVGMKPNDMVDTALEAHVAFLAAAQAHARIMERRSIRLAGVAPKWSAGALDRLLADLR